eukprot:gene7397-13150_t
MACFRPLANQLHNTLEEMSDEEELGQVMEEKGSLLQIRGKRTHNKSFNPWGNIFHWLRAISGLFTKLCKNIFIYLHDPVVGTCSNAVSTPRGKMLKERKEQKLRLRRKTKAHGSKKKDISRSMRHQQAIIDKFQAV